MISYSEWSARGQYNSDKAKAAWDFAEKQRSEVIIKLIRDLYCGLEINLTDHDRILLVKRIDDLGE